MNDPKPGGEDAPQDAPQDLELDESFDEQKSKVDAWEEDMRREREERNRTQSGS